jgi:cellulase/cellobiase CelA1
LVSDKLYYMRRQSTYVYIYYLKQHKKLVLTFFLMLTTLLGLGVYTLGHAQGSRAAQQVQTDATPVTQPEPTDPVMIIPTIPPLSLECGVTMKIVSADATGYIAEVTLTNTSETSWSDWEISWQNQQSTGSAEIVKLWNGTRETTPERIIVKNVPWNSQIPPSGKTTFGYQATGAPVYPQQIQINGMACTASSPTPSPSTQPTVVPITPLTSTKGSCTASYVVRNEWSNGFTADVIITNSTGTNLEGWEVRWQFPGDQTITTIWNASHQQSNQDVAIRNVSFNRVFEDSKSIAFGFTGSFSGTNTPPSSITLNGLECKKK